MKVLDVLNVLGSKKRNDDLHFKLQVTFPNNYILATSFDGGDTPTSNIGVIDFGGELELIYIDQKFTFGGYGEYELIIFGKYIDDVLYIIFNDRLLWENK